MRERGRPGSREQDLALWSRRLTVVTSGSAGPCYVAEMTVRIALMVAAFALCACGSPGAGDSTTPRSRRAKKSSGSPARPQDYEDENSVGMSKERVGRWRWKGDRKACYFVVDNECFRTRKKACATAGCDLEHCKTDGAAPARVTCPTADPP